METLNNDTNDLYDFWKDLDLKNLTEDEYLATVLGPKYLPLKMVIPLTIAYVTIFVTGIFGNVTTCIVIIRNPSMHTATNYYLFSLAISDLILLVLGEWRLRLPVSILFVASSGSRQFSFSPFVKTIYEGT